MVSPTVSAKDPQGWGLAGGGRREGGGAEDQVLDAGAHPAVETAFEGSERVREEGVPDADAGGKGVPEGVRPSVRDHQHLQSSS